MVLLVWQVVDQQLLLVWQVVDQQVLEMAAQLLSPLDSMFRLIAAYSPLDSECCLLLHSMFRIEFEYCAFEYEVLAILALGSEVDHRYGQ